MDWSNVEEMKDSTELLQRNRDFGHLLMDFSATEDGRRIVSAENEDPDMQISCC